ncbi:hypothetical protein D3C87_1954790 [compost metagenome]
MASIILIAINKQGSVDKFIEEFNKGLEKQHQCIVSKTEFVILCVAAVVFGFIIIPTLIIASVWEKIK